MADKVLITGCSSGFGHLTARLFQSKGWNVVATMRSPEKETELTKLDNVLVTKLDVTNPISIETAVKETMDKFGSIDVLVNNAGYGGHTLFEQDALGELSPVSRMSLRNPSGAIEGAVETALRPKEFDSVEVAEYRHCVIPPPAVAIPQVAYFLLVP